MNVLVKLAGGVVGGMVDLVGGGLGDDWVMTG